MKLWSFLKSQIKRYGNRLAFAHAGLTYADLLSFEGVLGGDKKILLCEAKTREEQAISILKCIASDCVCVPITLEYGERNYNSIKALLERADEERLNNLAFIIFTSGTTGTPKGVMLSEENIISNLQYIDSYFRIEKMTSICIARPLVHIAVLTGELLYALCKGLTIYFYEESFMPQRLVAYFLQHRIDVFCATPTLFQSLSRVVANCCIQVGVISGEILEKNACEQIVGAFPNTNFYHVYGLTEHSPRVSALLPSDFSRKYGSIGKPIGDIKIKIQNGELLVKSKSIMEGYFLDKIQTNRKIVDGWLYTGDRAHFDSDGFLYIDGRMDNMLIRSGINIYPEEIEAAVKEQVGVDDCILYGEKTDRGMMLSLKYIGNIEVKELRRMIAGVLNPNILPNKIEKVEELTRTPSGKKLR